jgi:uncharacterized damage-inducible protein DinB
MFYYITDFAKAWEYESSATQKLMDELTDASLSQAIAGGHRTLGRLAWHIATSIPEMMARTGIELGGTAEDVSVPARAEEIKKAYAQLSSRLLEKIKSNWTDATLAVQDDMYGAMWPRGQSLMVLIAHQTHHRGQMTVLMRQVGLKVPGIYGPAKEEWAAYGGEPPRV